MYLILLRKHIMIQRWIISTDIEEDTMRLLHHLQVASKTLLYQRLMLQELTKKSNQSLKLIHLIIIVINYWTSTKYHILETWILIMTMI